MRESIQAESAWVCTGSITPPSPPKLRIDHSSFESTSGLRVLQADVGELLESRREKGGDEVVKGDVKDKMMTSPELGDEV